ncbi:MAG: ABC transporter ATP-binding protein [Spirulinaceae cyanobacterium RM2_2_10]|nr:ABC transporter ATP-binding protein [Spirulinaceae cyanobacterium SM2_1_0]NJO20927.1 ABC transporter ATP-binding protein [Spirulinaceae cyanobacterium RM2_2_10]
MLPPTAGAAIIQMRGIAKHYGHDNTLVKALNDISLRVEPGEYCAIMGPSGSGKSTLMNVIGCLDRPTAGRYELDGTDVTARSEPELAEIRNRKLGFVFQQYHLLSQANALENVMLPMVYANVPKAERRDRAAAALGRVGLSDRLYNQPNQLSGGQQQRVAIARALVNEPVLLLADEPTGALDSHTTAEVLDLFGALNASGMTIVVVTHEPEVARHTQRITWLADGLVLHEHLTPDEMLEQVIGTH